MSEQEASTIAIDSAGAWGAVAEAMLRIARRVSDPRVRAESMLREAARQSGSLALDREIDRVFREMAQKVR